MVIDDVLLYVGFFLGYLVIYDGDMFVDIVDLFWVVDVLWVLFYNYGLLFEWLLLWIWEVMNESL